MRGKVAVTIDDIHIPVSVKRTVVVFLVVPFTVALAPSCRIKLPSILILAT
eukprot:jgi/Botrbrau1/18584/Bobra.0367s0026.1